MRLRKATPGDIALLTAWEQQPHVAEAGISGWDWDEMLSHSLEWRHLLIAEVNDRPIGFLQIIDPSRDDYWGDIGSGLRALDIWIGPPDALGRGYGTEMMHKAIDLCFEDDAVSAVLLDPLDTNTAAHRLYRRLGFTLIEHRRFDDVDCAIFQLKRADWRKDT